MTDVDGNLLVEIEDRQSASLRKIALAEAQISAPRREHLDHRPTDDCLETSLSREEYGSLAGDPNGACANPSPFWSV